MLEIDLAMEMDSDDRDTLTLSFKIPHVSRLLIFKDNWNNCVIMRRVITELLMSGHYTKIYLGSNPDSNYSSVMKDENCAIINIKIVGITLLEYKIDDYIDYFIAELQNRKNVLRFDNSLINRERQISSIRISIKITESVKVKSEIQAA